MANCEHCSRIHKGSYGSGRFCDSKCARAYSTSKDRLDINKKVSEKLKGKPSSGRPFAKGHDSRRCTFTKELQAKGIETQKLNRQLRFETAGWDEIPRAWKRRRLTIRQKGRCASCKHKTWLGQPIPLELHHIDGNNTNDSEENLVLLCNNCHALTPNFRNRKRQ